MPDTLDQITDTQDQTSSTSSNWTSSLPEDIRDNPVFSKYKNSEEALRGFLAVQPLIGADKIILPSKDAKPEEWHERVFDRLGRPKDPKEYPIPTDLQIPEDLPIDDKLIENFRLEAHKLGILPQQFQGIYKWFMNENISRYNDHNALSTKTRDDAETKLRTEWGAAYGQNLALARKVLDSFGDKDLGGWLTKHGLNNDPSFVKMMAKVGQSMSEGQLVGKPRGLTKTPEEAKEEINRIKSDEKSSYRDANHPDHVQAVEHMGLLYKLAYPNG